MEKGVFSPWEISGEINYEKLIKEFGLSPLKELPKIFNEEIAYRRKIIFAHRDIQRILETIKNKKKFVMMTGLMPTGKCDIYFQSERSKDAEKSNAYYRLQNILARHITFNEFKAVYGEISPGKMLSSLLQASDMLHPQLPEFEGDCPVVIPVGIDQDPHIRLARDISQRIKVPKFTQISSVYTLFIPGLNGGKMSSSNPNSFISISDSPEEVKNKINKYAFSGGKDTLEEHRKLGGNPDIDVSFQYLKFFFEQDDKKLAQIEKDYRSGKMLTSELKKYLIEKINSFLKEHQRKLEKKIK